MEEFNRFLESTGEFGEVVGVNFPLVKTDGLPGARLHEKVIFETGETGEIFTLNETHTEILLFSQMPVKSGTKVVRTGNSVSLKVGSGLLGQIINPLGKSLSSTAVSGNLEDEKELESEALGMSQRAKIRTPFLTGISVIDIMTPLGKGQKELFLGDRKTGKTSVALTTIKNQVKLGTIAIFACICKNKSEILKIKDFFERNKILEKVIVVATTPEDSPGLVYLTPYTAMAVAEYFRDQGSDTVVVLDDLTTHAKFYREISLIAKKFPGRDSYPGDIFYIHSHLLERAGNFKVETGEEASITVLPIAELIEGDLTGYIATNLMGMTDGHIFFDSSIFYQGRKPAVNIPFSVTRVGRQAQTSLVRSVNSKVLAFLTLYESVADLSHFGGELSEEAKNTLDKGVKIYTFFQQSADFIVPLPVQLVVLAMTWLNYLNDLYMINYLTVYFSENFANQEISTLFQSITQAEDFDGLIKNVANAKERLDACVK